MVAVWLVERGTRVLLKASVTVLIVITSALHAPEFRELQTIVSRSFSNVAKLPCAMQSVSRMAAPRAAQLPEKTLRRTQQRRVPTASVLPDNPFQHPAVE
jgi:hypothetical protein